MEAALALILHTSRKLGGYGIEAPELNRSLPVIGRDQMFWSGDHITPDLLWNDAKLVIEYDSDLHHSASSRIANDARRRDVLIEMGYRVITVTSEHMRSYLQIDRIAHMVANSLGVDISTKDEAELNQRARYQAPVRHLATHPRELLALPKSADKRAWTPRPHSGVSSSA